MKIGLSRTTLFATEGVILIAAGFAVFYLLSGGDIPSVQFLKQKASSGDENTQDPLNVEKQTTTTAEIKPAEEIAENQPEATASANIKETTLSSEIEESSSSSESAQTE